MPVINGVYTKDFPALGRAPIDTDIIPIAEVANQITYKSTIGEVFNAKVFGTTGRLSKFTGANTLGNSILNEIGNAIHLTNGGTSYASFGIINPGTPGDPGIDNDAYIGSTINNDFTIRVNNTEAARFDTAFRFKITNIPNATTDTDKFLVSDAGVVKYRTGTELRSDIGAGVGSVTSVGLTMPPAFNVANSPITGVGTLAVTGAGTASQYIRGDGSLATIPSTSSGGSSVNYYLNGSVAASVAGYYQMDNSAVIGTGTDFNLTGNGLIAQFLTDAGNPNRLLIPGGAWNFEMYFNVSSSGGNTKFYVELLKYNGTTFTSIASSSTTPEEITSGTTIDLYVTSVAVPETVLLITDRLAIRVYIVDNSGGRTVTLHTEDNTLCEIITTFSGGISALNGLTANTQYFGVGTSGNDFNISSVSDTHTFNIPSASATARGLITTGTQTIAGTKTFSSDAVVNGVNIGRGGGNIASNTRVGQNAGLSNTTGIYNSFIGYQSGYYNTSGDHNSFIGAYSGHYNTFGYDNSSIGAYSAHNNTTGYDNSFIGYLAGYANTSGDHNSFIGVDSGGRNTTGSYNLFIGFQAGNFISNSGNNVTPSNSIFLGCNTKALNNNETNQIVIGYNAVGQGSNTVTIGNSSITNNYFTGNIRGGAFIKSGGTSSQFLKADGSVDSTAYGTGSVTSVSALTLGTSGTDLNSTVANSTTTPVITLNVPDASATARGVITTGTQTIAGTKTFSSDAVVNGVNIGKGGGSISTNTRIGSGALSSNTGGFSNSAFGYNALASVTNGGDNTANGISSLTNLTTGNSNTASGSTSLSSTTTGGKNTASGYNSLGFNTTGSNNVSFGYNAGAFTANGITLNSISNNSVYLGHDTRASASGNTNEIVIGDSVIGGGSNSVTLGNSSILITNLQGNVGIGYTTNPSLYKLDVNGTGRFSDGITVKAPTSSTAIALLGRSGDNFSALRFQSNSGATTYATIYSNASDLVFENNGSARLTIASTGAATFSSSVGIGITPASGVSLHISGGLIRNIDTYNNTTATAANLVVSAGGTFERSTSSLKYKTDVKNYDKGLNELMSIYPKYYKGINDGDTVFAGLIAEEIHDLGLTEFVQYAVDGTPDALAYTHMVALLVNAIKELNEKITQLENK